ncbi:4-hydroxybenzoate octaprenyltransferase [Neorickettsia risticii]|uniref:4-hydroxybenzoate octaprenyltransferase n=1 Tax=Neorickettsia risticii (strain Illinois) TaxID=434131 RepID=C6V5S7_NEORI|nr:4-hydroxybenzoate octaprenyltransferase [Neorickettsia risticii]ACT69743.1 4-hydroxybenzoate octaprenyltransferase [Neorickettsia risticii str. Illinois]
MKIKKYASLIRFQSLGGMWLCFFPALFVVALLGSSFYSFLWIPFFLLGAFLVRSAGCIANDIADRNIDGKVKRTASRPIASGEVSVTEAVLLFLILLILATVLLAFLPLEATALGAFTIVGVVVYPFSKRYFAYPQLLLAVIFNVGALFASIVVVNSIHASALFIYLACFFWTLYYDTIYGHQDKRYDAALGVHSLSLGKFGSKEWLKKYARLALSFLAFSAVLPGLNLLYYIGLAALFFMEEKFTESINLDDPKNCGIAFKRMNFVGVLIFFIILLGRL